jgi:hypothetical protein
MTRTLHPRHGIHEPTGATPALRPGSVRRTSTVDMLRPDGLLGRVVVDARAKDLPGGETRLSGEIDYTAGWTLRALHGDEPRLGELVGGSVRSGFRRRVQEALPEHYAGATRLHLLLDDFPVATLVSGYALSAGGVQHDVSADRAPADQCSGWRSDGTIMLTISRHRAIPVVTGPEAPEVGAGWHELPPLTPHAVRRARRLDVWQGDGAIEVDSFYRDSHLDADGLETVVHEYTVRARLDPADYTILELAATPRVLPWVECPSAAASADRLLGRPVGELRPLVRKEFTGISTCTHLNDQLRSLADVPALARNRRAAST